MKIDNFLYIFWQDFATRLCPSAPQIQSLFATTTQEVVNDHIALRTFSSPLIGLDVLGKLFESYGYVAKDSYKFEKKHLLARYYAPPSADQPKIFISELLIEQCSEKLQARVNEMIWQMDKDLQTDPLWLTEGRPWPLSFSTYQELAQESEYAAWVAAHGFGANHFTASVNQLGDAPDLVTVIARLERAGFTMNDFGGKIKGDASVFLAQSATLADQIWVDFEDGKHQIPGGFYEFAKRYPLPDGSLYQGFVPTSADLIFQSTDRHA